MNKYTKLPVQVKICGITNLEDAQVAFAAGADFLGFNFYRKSPRYVEPEEARRILDGLARYRDEQRIGAVLPRAVGVFVNAAADEVRRVMDVSGVDLAQLHGDEPPELVSELAGQAFKAIRPADNAAATEQAEMYAPLSTVERGPCLLIDAYDAHAYGGTGKRADWSAAAELAARHDGIMLAGGLTAENVADAVRGVRPWGVDVSSGVEASPRRKDHAAVVRFIAAAKGVS